MRILAFESSAKAASVALMEDGTLVAESFVNNGKTHSATLMPMAQQLLRDCGVAAGDLDAVAVARGPGSFTGVRIGVAAAKGLAWAAEKPVCGVSTLEAMAFQLRQVRGIVCPVMDARRAQVYNALFSSDGETLTRCAEDRAISLDESDPAAGASGDAAGVGGGDGCPESGSGGRASDSGRTCAELPAAESGGAGAPQQIERRESEIERRFLKWESCMYWTIR